MLSEIQVDNILFGLSRSALLLYALFPLVEGCDEFATPYVVVIICLFALFFVGCVTALCVNHKKAAHYLIGNTTGNVADLFIALLGLTIYLYAKDGFPDIVWIIIIFVSLLNLLFPTNRNMRDSV